MGLARGISCPLLFLALVTLIVSTEAGFLDSLRGAFKGLANKVKRLTSDVMEKATKKSSVLSKFFGDGATREDLTLPQIFNTVFSRHNSITVSNAATKVKEGKLRGGSNVTAAMSTGGAISVTTNSEVVLATTGTSVNGNQEQSGEDESDNDRDKPQKREKDDEERKDVESNIDDKGGDASNSGGDTDETADAASFQQTDNGSTTYPGSDLDNAFIELLSDWDKFVTNSVWDIQEERKPERSTEDRGDEDPHTSSSSRIINGVVLGNQITSGAPFAVRFFYNNEENFYCSGSLIGYPYAITAAHCGVVLGDEVRVSGRLLRSGFKATVDEVFTHPKFDPASLIHDVAIVRLDGLEHKAVLNKNGVKAAHINGNRSFPDTGFVGIVSAHGSIDTDGQGVSEELQSTRHSVYDLDKCKEEITQGEVNDEESYLCTGDGKRSTTCVGDSGAGLWRYRVKKIANGKTRGFYEIFGVVSFGEVTDDALCPRGPPAVFQKTSTNYKWIREVIGKENMP